MQISVYSPCQSFTHLLIHKKNTVMDHQALSSIGTISKKENLASVEYLTNSHALILESLFPFPGYNGTTVPDRTDPRALFFVTKSVNNDDKIIRAIRSARQASGLEFDGAPGHITLQNNSTGVIRIKNLPYDQAAPLATAFEKEGIELMRDRKVPEYCSIIHITKYFQIMKMIHGIYSDQNWKNMFYIEIPMKLKWNTFEKITMDIKHNIDISSFDAALTTMYDASGILDFVRIYDEHSDVEKLDFIRKKYLDAIKYL